MLSKPEDAGVVMVIARELGGGMAAKAVWRLKYGIQHDKDAAYGVMTPDFIKTCQRDCTYAHHLSDAFALLGETEEALEWLETAVNAGFINYPMLAEHDPLLANIRGEERFKRLMERVKQEWEAFEV